MILAASIAELAGQLELRGHLAEMMDVACGGFWLLLLPVPGLWCASLHIQGK